jgi:hypothetical protein
MKARPYVHLYGSLAAMHPVKNDSGIFNLPLSLHANIKECLDDGRYLDFFPNSHYNSNWFFLKKGKLQQKVNNNFARRGRDKKPFYDFKQTYTVIGWYDCNKLGREHLDLTDELHADLMNNVFYPGIENQDKKILINVENVTNISNAVPDVFKPLQPLIQQVDWNLYPFGFYSNDFDISYMSNCFDDMEEINPIECYEFGNQENQL